MSIRSNRPSVRRWLEHARKQWAYFRAYHAQFRFGCDGDGERKILTLWNLLARPERFELPTYWFEASRSIHLSYGRVELIVSSHQTWQPRLRTSKPKSSCATVALLKMGEGSSSSAATDSSSLAPSNPINCSTAPAPNSGQPTSCCASGAPEPARSSPSRAREHASATRAARRSSSKFPIPEP